MWKGEHKKGFTLIELLISLTLVAMLAAGVVALIGIGPKQAARDARRRSDLEKIASALELYRNDRGTYPTVANYPTTCAGPALPCLRTTYIGNPFPVDPVNATAYPYTPTCGATCTTYTLCADLEKVPGVNDYCIRNP